MVGGGAAGLSAALVLGRARRRVVVVDAGEPRNRPAAHMQGFLSRDGMPPSELVAVGRQEVTRYGVELVADRVSGVEPGFFVRLAAGGILRARRLLITTGLRDRLPAIPGVHERWGRDVLHCPYCHGWEVRDQPVGVLGTNADAIDHALLIRQWSADVVFFAHTVTVTSDDRRRLSSRGIRVVTGEVARLVVTHDEFTGVELTDGQIVHRAAVFVRPVTVPHPDGFFEHLGCELEPTGFPVTDRVGRTTAFGVWAAGNAADPRAQVITSAGAGSAAAIAINADLVIEDVDRAVEASRPRLGAVGGC